MSPLAKSQKELLRFVVVGFSAVVIDYATYQLFLWGGVMDVAFAKGTSYIIGAVFGFVCNKAWTFESVKPPLPELIKYAILYAASAVVNSLVNSFVLSLFGIGILAFLSATAVSTVMNFLGQKFFVFRGGRDE